MACHRARDSEPVQLLADALYAHVRALSQRYSGIQTSLSSAEHLAAAARADATHAIHRMQRQLSSRCAVQRIRADWCMHLRSRFHWHVPVDPTLAAGSCHGCTEPGPTWGPRNRKGRAWRGPGSSNSHLCLDTVRSRVAPVGNHLAIMIAGSCWSHRHRCTRLR